MMGSQPTSGGSSEVAMNRLVLVVSAALLAAAPLGAQGRGSEKKNPPDIPVAYRPPPGMCRIWIDGVPPAQQSAPTDCTSAVRNKPANARVIFGDDYVKRHAPEKDKDRRSPVDPRRLPRRPDTSEAGGIPSRLPLPGRVRFPGRPGGDDDRAERQEQREDDYVSRRRSSGDDRRTGRDAADRPDRGPSGGVVVLPPADDPRYYNNGRTPPPGRNSSVCLDRDDDGWCDDARFGQLTCLDLDRDGRCDDLPEASLAYPQALPAMRSAADVVGGRGSGEVARWLGTTEVTPRLTDLDRDGVPERVLWLDANGALVQVWSDRDRDGRADRVEVYRNGRRVKLLGR
jgi:hypothetical protein